MGFHRVWSIFVVLALLLGAQYAVAGVQNTGTQQHLILSAAKPSAIGTVTFSGQVVRTPKTKGELTTAYLGLKNASANGLSIEPIVGYVGGWYPGSDGVSVGSKFGLKRGPFSCNLSFEWFTNTEGGYRQHTKFWVHSAGYTAGLWTIGGIFQKVDRIEKIGPTIGYKGGSHWALEGRWYRSLKEDPKFGSHVENGRIVLKIS